MSQTVGEISTTRPLAIKVFQRHGIDFCCGGKRPLEEACVARGLDPARVLEEIAVEEELAGPSPQRWDQAPLADVIEHLLQRYHAPLREDLLQLVAMARRVVEVHGQKDHQLAPVLAVVLALRADLEPHMEKEEQVLFPWILQGQGSRAYAPMSVMRAEHEEVGRLLAEARRLTANYTVPAGACATWTALWRGLERLEQDLVEHIALENNVLFPRALAGEA